MLAIIAKRQAQGKYPLVNPPCQHCTVCPTKILRGQALCPILDADIMEKKVKKEDILENFFK